MLRFISYLRIPIELNPSITPAPTTWPRLAVASSSGKPNPFSPLKGKDGPKPLT